MTKLKPLSGKRRQSVRNYFSQSLVIGTFLENGFEATLISKANVLSVWKNHISTFWKFLSEEAETAFWKKEARRSTLFKSKFSHRKLLRKWFWSYLKLENECFECLKGAFLSFLQSFEWRSWERFLGKGGKAFDTLNQNLVIGSFLVNGFEATLSLKTNVLSVWKGHF